MDDFLNWWAGSILFYPTLLVLTALLLRVVYLVDLGRKYEKLLQRERAQREGNFRKAIKGE